MLRAPVAEVRRGLVGNGADRTNGTHRLFLERNFRLKIIYARPHPGPLPRGEGESLADSGEIQVWFVNANSIFENDL